MACLAKPPAGPKFAGNTARARHSAAAAKASLKARAAACGVRRRASPAARRPKLSIPDAASAEAGDHRSGASPEKPSARAPSRRIRTGCEVSGAATTCAMLRRRRDPVLRQAAYGGRLPRAAAATAAARHARASRAAAARAASSRRDGERRRHSDPSSSASEARCRSRRGLRPAAVVAAATRGYCRRVAAVMRSSAVALMTAVARRRRTTPLTVSSPAATRGTSRPRCVGTLIYAAVATATQRASYDVGNESAAIQRASRTARRGARAQRDLGRAPCRCALCCALNPRLRRRRLRLSLAAAEKASLRELVATAAPAAQAVQAPARRRPTRLGGSPPVDRRAAECPWAGAAQFAIPIAPPPGDPESPLPPPPKGKIDRALASLDKARSEARQKATIAAVQKWWLSPGRLFFRSGARTALVARFRLGEQKPRSTSTTRTSCCSSPKACSHTPRARCARRQDHRGERRANRRRVHDQPRVGGVAAARRRRRLHRQPRQEPRRHRGPG